MRFKTFLNEARYYQTGEPLSVEDVNQKLQQYCSEALQKYNQGCAILRGIPKRDREYNEVDNTSFMLFNASTRQVRKSANTENYYTLLLDSGTMPGWKDMPKRSKALICTSSFQKTRSYGDSYFVFPVNGSRVGVCPEEDFWDSFYKENSDVAYLSSFNNILDFVATIFFQKQEILDNDDAKVLISQLQSIPLDNPNVKGKMEMYYSEVYKWMIAKKCKTLFDFAKAYLNIGRKKTRIKSMNIAEYSVSTSRYNYGVEVWTDGTCILVKTTSAKMVPCLQNGAEKYA